MSVREIHKPLKPLGFVQVDELLGFLDGGGRAGRPLRKLVLQVDNLLGGSVGVFYRAFLAVGAWRAALTGAFELEDRLEIFLPFCMQAQGRRVGDGDFLVLLNGPDRVDKVCQQVGRKEILCTIQRSRSVVGQINELVKARTKG